MRDAVAVVGSLNIDLTVRTERFPEPGETLTGSELSTAPGGKGSNQAVAAALLGSTVRIIGAVGPDPNGDLLLRQAQEAGVEVGAVQRLADHATGAAMIVVNAAGENTIIVSPGANGALSPAAVTPEVLGDAAVVCLCLEVPVDTAVQGARAGRAAGARVVLNLSPYAAVPADLLALTDVLLVNQTEAERILDKRGIDADWPGALDGFRALGIDRAIVTLGAAGSVVLDASDVRGSNGRSARITAIDPVPVEAVDTTGCGDAFTGAVAHVLATGASLVEAAQFASKVSALAATDEGAQSSYRRFAHLRR
ncbi:MAG: ribokinase [Intrasporangium sp.]|uniref:ribokinase n=1 Tax=Intrasporangium sp. TaxID=1925024 RepID=UPI002647CCCD|nr:ribokinase [Intrasporangium sp.]MDN5795415.1 ribokinase [Intrasporangium sp.]